MQRGTHHMFCMQKSSTLVPGVTLDLIENDASRPPPVRLPSASRPSPVRLSVLQEHFPPSGLLLLQSRLNAGAPGGGASLALRPTLSDISVGVSVSVRRAGDNDERSLGIWGSSDLGIW
ncbi:hypothetical protein EYF80_054702 [Liparis tanakae]|uniref:Uncharacterized protein n=1 Tax=Liparis tanakae TaxID=230148 RepID=A0A4Z2F254_9TELE|nr:hypothetical protein EYF80_054702 [Liparis tanakae]